MIRACAAVGLACVTANGKSVEGLSTLQSASLSQSGESATSQLAVAEKMQQTLSHAVKSVIDLSDPDAMARLNNELIPLLETQMEAMKVALVDENSEDEQSIVTANEAVAQCNAERKNSFEKADGVDFKQYETHRLRGEHKTCRDAEVVAADKAETDCNTAQGLADDAVLSTPSCDDANTVPSDMNAVNQWVTHLEGLQSGLHDAVGVCNASTTAFENKQGECDQDQEDFESQFCTFAMDLNTTCDTHGTCYAEKLLARQNLETSVRNKVTSQKELWAAMCRIHCFIDLFKEANTSNLLVDRHEECLGDGYVCPVGDDSGLDVLYPAPDGEDDCDTARQWWNETEYDALNQTYINDPIACVENWRLD